MNDPQEPTTWQELLKRLIEDPQEKARLAEAIQVKPVTLMRWAESMTRPRHKHLLALIKNFPPESSELFRRLLEADFPEYLREESSPEESLPREYISEGLRNSYAIRMLRNQAMTGQLPDKEFVKEFLMQMMLEQLAPGGPGPWIILASSKPSRPQDGEAETGE